MKKFILLILTGTALLYAPNFVNAAGLPAPVISIAPESYYPLDEVLYIEGRSTPSVKMELFFEKTSGGAQPIRVTLDANSNGEWYLSQKLELSSGEWSVRARALNDSSYSDWSNPRIIRSVVSGIVFGSIKIRYLPIAVFLLFLFTLSAVIFIYVLVRARNLKNLEREKALQEKTALLEKSLHEKEKEVFGTAIDQNFGEIRRRIMDELEHLNKKACAGNELSREEAEHQEKLLRELREAEEVIQKKLKEM